MQEVLSVVLGLIAFLLLGLCWSLVKAQDLLEDENDELNNVVVDCLKELDQQDSDIKDLNDKIGVLRVQLDNVDAQKAKVETNLREARAGIKSRQDSIEHLRSFSTSVIKERDNLARELEIVKNRCAAVTRGADIHAKEVDAILDEKDGEIGDLRAEIGKLREVNDTLTLTLAKFER